eukprot:s5014_g8.t1
MFIYSDAFLAFPSQFQCLKQQDLKEVGFIHGSGAVSAATERHEQSEEHCGKPRHRVPPQSHITAWCSASSGTNDRLRFPSTTVPTLSVDSGLTLSAGAFDASASTGNFDTSSGTFGAPRSWTVSEERRVLEEQSQ